VGHEGDGKIDSFDDDSRQDHSDGDELLEIVSMIPEVGMDAALQRTAHLPNFGRSATEALHMLERQHSATLAANAHSQADFHQACRETRKILETLLNEGDLDWGQRKDVIELLMRILEMQRDKDTENKGLLSSLSGPLVVAGVALAGAGLMYVNREALVRAANALRSS
jgi:hypothetical protein